MKSILPDDLPNPVIVYDSNWKISKINVSAISLLGYLKAEELTGKPFKGILHESEYITADTISRDLENSKIGFLGKDIRHLRKDGTPVSLFSQFGIIKGNQDADGIRYIQSGIYSGEDTRQDQQLKKLNCLKILADNVPGLMMLLIDEKHEIKCSFGSEKYRPEIDDAQAKMLEERLPIGILVVLEQLLEIAFDGTSVSREFKHENDHFSVRLIPVSNQNSDKLCVILLQNITETKIIENKLKVAKEAAEVANDAKSAFIAKMSHEIRTPLNAILGFAAQLKKTKLTKRQSTYLDVVNDSSRHLLSIIDDILVLTRIESGQLEVDEVPFSLEDVIKTMNDLFSLRVREKKLDFQINFDPPVRDVLLGDPAKIRQVLINLIANAIKFTHKGGVVLSCSVIERTKEKLIIRFDITDSGIGIEAGEVERIFRPFQQVDNSLGRSYFGTGLGLTISKDLLQSMGSEISVQSSPGEGSIFSFILTLKISKTQLPKYDSGKSNLPLSLPGKLSILFTDDDPVSRLLGRVILSQYNVRSVFAVSGDEAIRKFKPGRFNIVILDINMPGTSGVDVANYIRKIESSNKGLPYTKIIAMTANVVRKHIKEYLKAGMDDFILKPFTETDLIEKIVIHSTDKAIGCFEPQEDSRFQGNDKDYDLSELLRITKGDTDYTLLMLDSFLENGKRMLDQMLHSYNNGDYRSIAEAAHRLLPSVEQLGFKKATSLLKRIEARYLEKSKFRKDPELIEQAIHEVESCLEKISIARNDIL